MARESGPSRGGEGGRGLSGADWSRGGVGATLGLVLLLAGIALLPAALNGRGSGDAAFVVAGDEVAIRDGGALASVHANTEALAGRDVRARGGVGVDGGADGGAGGDEVRLAAGSVGREEAAASAFVAGVLETLASGGPGVVERDAVGSGAERVVVVDDEPGGIGLLIDINSADVEELALLPRIGPALASRIVEDRAARGRFASVSDLSRVRGIGARTVELISPFATTGVDSPAVVGVGADGEGAGGGSGGGSGGVVVPDEPTRLVDVNEAGVEELESLPGIGPALASRIVEERRANGRYRSAEDLRRVRGIGAKTVEGLRGLVRIGPGG